MIALREELPNDFVERIEKIFSADGLLAGAKNFEYRREQQQMAVAVARALSEERHLVVEAGTGVGKSLAYLVPAIMHAKEQKKKAIVSTYTINLQEQLIYKDIPILQKTLPFEFEAALWKGRQNYLCPKRLERALSKGAGSVDIIWSQLPGDGCAELVWTERGGPPVHDPGPSRGFGLRLLTQGLASDLGKPAQVSFDSAGLTCTLVVSTLR